MSEQEIIDGCKNNDRQCQRALYDMFAAKMFAICNRYAQDKMEAQDILQDGFVKVFGNLYRFKPEGGSLGGWIRTIMVNTAIELYRKRKHNVVEQADELPINKGFNENTIELLDAKIILELVQHLPLGYRQVFNLYAVEGYTHHEIGELLGISTGTSKSQYSHARHKLMEMIEIKKLKENVAGKI